MGRKSKLTEKEWDELSRRALAGTPVRQLAREVGISESSIREKISAQNRKIKRLAEQKVRVEEEIKALPVSAQTQVSILASEMMAISANLATAGKFGSIVARHSMGIAAKQMAKVDQNEPMESAEILQGVAALTRIANESSTIGLNLMKKNEAALDEQEHKTQQPTKIVLVSGQRRDRVTG